MVSFYRYLLEAAASLVVLMLVYRIFLREETHFHLNRLYLIGSGFLVWIIPLVNLPSPFFTRAVPAGFSGEISLTGPAPRPLLPLLIYCLGAGLMGVRFVLQLIRLRAILRKGTIVGQVGRCRILEGGDVPPFSFFGTIFINRERVSERDLTRILAHETVHVRQLHSLDILLMEVVTILQWFNPFVWPYRSALKEIHEYLADSAVFAQGGGAGYQRLILEQHIGGRLFEFANNLSQSRIKRRITMMTREKSRARTRLKVLLAVPAAALLLLAFAEPRLVSGHSHDGLETAAVLEGSPAAEGLTPEQEKKAEQEKKQQELDKKKQEQALAEKEKQRLLKIKQLKLKLEKTDDPDTRKKIKAYLAEMEANGSEEEELSLKRQEAKLRMKELKEKLAATEDPDLRKKIKSKLAAMETELLKMKKQEEKKRQAEESEKK